MRKLLLFALVLMVTSCAKKIYPDGPQAGVFPERPVIKESKVILPLSTNINDIQSKLNAEFPSGRIYSTGKVESGNSKRYWVDVYREAPISFTASGDVIRARIPIKVKAKASVKACAGWWRGHWRCVGASHTQNARNESNVAIDLVIRPKLNADYSVAVDLGVDANVVGSSHLTFHLLGFRFSISIKSILQNKLNDFIRDKKPEIQAAVNEAVSKLELKKEVAKYWQLIGKPIPLGDSGLSLNSHPTALYFQNIHSADGKMNIALGLGSKLQISDAAVPNDSPLPDLTLLSPGDNGVLHLRMPIGSSFQNITTQVKAQTVGKTVQHKKYRFKIQDVNFSGISGDGGTGILSTVDFKCNRGFLLRGVKGKIHLKLVPAYDKEKDSIYIRSFELTPETNSALLDNTVSFLTDKVFYNDIITSMHHDFTEEKSKLLNELQSKLTEYKVDKLTIRGNIEHADFEGIYIDKDLLEVLIDTKVKVNTDPITLE